ncbi:hypothetical protein KCP78_15965 [Salmonella enterica subsp. enterica]|nr:hypothetical protein KCP78_15965 [Salmonella enterica subsp. enterica]
MRQCVYLFDAQNVALYLLTMIKPAMRNVRRARQLRNVNKQPKTVARAFAACSLKGKFAVWRGRRATPRKAYLRRFLVAVVLPAPYGKLAG